MLLCFLGALMVCIKRKTRDTQGEFIKFEANDFEVQAVDKRMIRLLTF